VPAAADGERLDRFLVTCFPEHSRSHLAEWIRDGRVAVDAATVKPGLALRAGWILRVEPPDPPLVTLVAEDLPLTVLHEDDALIVVDKAAGMVVHPGAGHASGTLVHALLGRCGALAPLGLPWRPGIVHRLDRDTSGVMVVARTEAAHLRLARQFSEHTVDRRYLALVWDHRLADAGTLSTLYGRHPTDRLRFSGRVQAGKTAITHFRVLERLPPFALVECRLDTGRTHQIRVHLSEAGSPLVGDETYGARRRVERPEALRRLGPELGLARQFLHALRLGFTHPETGTRMVFESPLPPDLALVLATLRAVHAPPAVGGRES